MAGTPKRETTLRRHRLIRDDFEQMTVVEKIISSEAYDRLEKKYGLSRRTLERICTGSRN